MKSKMLCVVALLILWTPSQVQAFTAENERVLRLSDDVWLYVNTAEYGSASNEVSVPIATAPNWRPRISGDYLRYQVLLSGRPMAGLDTQAAVLSAAPIKAGRYVVPVNESYRFTLVALITIPGAVLPSERLDLSLEVTSGE